MLECPGPGEDETPYRCILVQGCGACGQCVWVELTTCQPPRFEHCSEVQGPSRPQSSSQRRKTTGVCCWDARTQPPARSQSQPETAWRNKREPKTPKTRVRFNQETLVSRRNVVLDWHESWIQCGPQPTYRVVNCDQDCITQSTLGRAHTHTHMDQKSLFKHSNPTSLGGISISKRSDRSWRHFSHSRGNAPRYYQIQTHVHRWAQT